MKTKREMEIVLLTFALSSFIWCVVWAFMLGKISREYEHKLELLIP